MTTYTLRITYLTSNRRARVQNVRGLVWADVLALQAVLQTVPSTISTHATCETSVTR